MKSIRRILIGTIALGLIAISAYLALPYVGDPRAFAIGFIACLVLVTIILIVSQRNSFSRNNRLGTLTITAVLLLAGLAFGFVITTLTGISESNRIRNEQQQRLEQAKIEAARLSSQMTMASSLLDDIRSEVEQSPDNEVSDAMIDRLATLSFTLKPRFLVEADTTSSIELSPERGRLLLALSSMGIDSASLNRIFKRTSFEGADLRGADMTGVYLSKARLRGSNFRDAILIGADLSGADMHSAVLWGSNLNDANCQDTDFRRADLRWVELNRATLRNAKLSSAQLGSAKLRNADLRDITMEWAFAPNAFFNDAIMINASLLGTSFEKAHMQNCDLSGANMRLAVLYDTNLTGARLTETTLRSAKLSKTNLSDADLTDAIVDEPDWFSFIEKSETLGVERLRNNLVIIPDSTMESHYILRQMEQ